MGETLAKFEFAQNGWNPYSHFFDVGKVDFLLRREEGENLDYREVQVKYGKLYSVGSEWERALFDVTSLRFFQVDEIKATRPDLYLTYV